MFRYFSKTAFNLQSRFGRRISHSASLTVGVSTTLLCLGVAGRNTIRLDDSGSGLDEDLSSPEEKLRRQAQERFQRPQWSEDDYHSADRILSSGPTWYPGERAGIVRCDALIVNANAESEDSIAVYFPDTDEEEDRRSYLALFDGHNGPAMSDFLSDHLIAYVALALSSLSGQLPQQFELSGYLDMQDDFATVPDHDAVSDAIKQAFKEVDDAMIDVTDVLASPSKTNAIRTLRQAESGSCALMSIYETDTHLLRVALTGDSRAVLGRKVGTDGRKAVYDVRILSQDQNANNPAEVARLRKEHPGEEVAANGRVMGWGMARAFGDAAFKWSLDIQQQLYDRYLGRSIRPNMKTPPYLTAEPEVTTTRIRKGDFLIMASDGLWDCLTSEEAVGLVGVWLANHHDAVYTSQPVEDFTKKRFKDEKLYGRDELPLKVRLEKDGKDDKTPYYPYWRTAKQFVNWDDSPAAHLARNALGGADSDLTEALLSMTVPQARRYRDDVGIIVAFF